MRHEELIELAGDLFSSATISYEEWAKNKLWATSEGYAKALMAGATEQDIAYQGLTARERRLVIETIAALAEPIEDE